MSLSSLVMAIGLMFLSVSDPPPPASHTDSCIGNRRAYDIYKTNRAQFSANVETSVSGGTVDGVYYEAASFANRKRSLSVEVRTRRRLCRVERSLLIHFHVRPPQITPTPIIAGGD